MSQYLSDCIFGSVDGIVTSFSIISAVKGASMKSDVALIIGLSGLIADAVSVGISTYLSAQTMEAQGLKTKTPFLAGFCTLFSFILMGLIPLSVFFLARVWPIADNYLYPLAVGLTLFALFLTGVFKGLGLGQAVFSSGLQTAGMGGFAAAVAYGLGYFLDMAVRPVT
jgi:VIT1/CCC1 family predicted Fe2+/Mn2+ transporter